MALAAANCVCNRLRDMALDSEVGDDFDFLNSVAYVVEAAYAAAGYLRNAKIDLETGAPKATAIRTIDGGLIKLESALAEFGQ